MVDFETGLRKMEDNLGGVIRGKAESIRLLLICLLAGGHALLEDVPGTGKTTLAKSLARSMDGIFHRIQFTPDLMPADITGSSFYNTRDGSFEFREGPVFANVVLADEINRTSPRTQSALLEVMSENQVTADGRRRPLPQPFFVVATQNPADYHGTYPLPEAQLDRFAVRVTLGYPD
ncbi:MAG: AAA family ATPase, partial [Armatimonadota bacterium]|nr:AAA family ATPase [Armatimonadota bacterium]